MRLRCHQSVTAPANGQTKVIYHKWCDCYMIHLLGRIGEEGWGKRVQEKEDKVDGKGLRGDGEVGKVADWPTQSRNLARWGLGSCCSGSVLSRDGVMSML